LGPGARKLGLEGMRGPGKKREKKANLIKQPPNKGEKILGREEDIRDVDRNLKLKN